MSHLSAMKTTIVVLLLALGSYSSVKAEESYMPEHKRVLVSGLYEAAGDRFSFGHRELIDWHLRTEEQIRERNLRSAEQITELKKPGYCSFKTGECQKEVKVSLPLESLDYYAEFLALTARGEVHPIRVVKIETTVLLYLSAQGRLDIRSSGYGTLTAKSESTGNKIGAFVFALPKGTGKMHVESITTRDGIASTIRVSEKDLSIEDKQVTNRQHIKAENIKKLYKVSFENLSDRYVAIYWTAETPCQENFSMFHLESNNEEPEWRGWGCDV